MTDKIDEYSIDEIIKQIRTRPIGGHAVGREQGTHGQLKDDDPDYIKAIRASVLLLADNKWHPTSRIKTISKLNKVNFERLCDDCGIAQSDNGYWVCIPGAGTPETAPDE